MAIENEIINRVLSTEEHHIITPWGKTPDIYSLRLSLNLSEKNKLTPFNYIPEDDVELSLFIMCEEMRKCKHRHSIKIPFKKGNSFNLNNELIITEVYGFLNNKNINEEISLFLDSTNNKYIVLKSIVDNPNNIVLYSELFIDNTPPALMGVDITVDEFQIIT
ncbi:MAG: hypothetical protein KAS32_01840 [Candidatus Peribacteraceae bacterium]|nr:hypothetical protein [Candidatus Peribacteraceae bacterium]